jgi:hypothetical protein
VADNESRLSPWMRNGRASFLAWVIALAAYLACSFAKVDAPEVTYGLIGFTGLLIGNLGLAQGKRNAQVEDRSKQTRRRVDQLEEDVDNGRTRADRSEYREGQWSQHKNHRGDYSDDG